MFGTGLDQELCRLAALYPGKEACGYIGADHRAVLVENVALTPSDEWRMRPGAVPSDALAVWHSHPDGPAYPSHADMVYSIASALPHAIVVDDSVLWFGEGVPKRPLIGREFRHGITDCYSAIRDAYFACSIDLPDYPREWQWWNNGENLYNDFFKHAGFKEIEFSDALPGDVLLFCIRSNVINHAAIWCGGDLIFHHVSANLPIDTRRLSVTDSLARWQRFLAKVLKHENGSANRTIGETLREKLFA